eukprot:scaffold99132_cov69-Phaeocystis_antarctica.AAC.2
MAANAAARAPWAATVFMPPYGTPYGRATLSPFCVVNCVKPYSKAYRYTVSAARSADHPLHDGLVLSATPSRASKMALRTLIWTLSGSGGTGSGAVIRAFSVARRNHHPCASIAEHPVTPSRCVNSTAGSAPSCTVVVTTRPAERAHRRSSPSTEPVERRR